MGRLREADPALASRQAVTRLTALNMVAFVNVEAIRRLVERGLGRK
jgi:hypothetical protein